MPIKADILFKLLLPTAAALTMASAPLAHAEGYACQKRSCLNDPNAWSAALGNRPQDREAQAQARQVAGVQAAQEAQSSNAALLQGMPPFERQKLLYQLEGQLSVLSKKDAVVVTAFVSAVGEGYLFCGSALYNPDDSGIFVLDTRPSATATLHADRSTYRQAGCEKGGIALR